MKRATLALIAALTLGAAPAPRGESALRDPVRLVQAGRDLEARGQLAQAIGFYDRALSLDPANGAALIAAGENSLRRGDGPDAFSYYTALTRARPSSGDAWLGVAAALVLRLKPQDALNALAKAEALGASTLRIGPQRGLAYDLLGDFRSAQVAYAGALAMDPANVETARRLALSLAVSGSRPAALQVMRRFEQDQAMSVPLRQTLALIYALTGDPDMADEIARSILPGAEARQMSAFFAALPALSPHDKTIAALFGRLPGATPPSETRARAVIDPPPAPPVPQPMPTHIALAPERLWVQLANVSDPARVGEAWAAIAKAGQGEPDLHDPKSTAGPAGTRLLIGPFADRAAMNAAVARLKGRGISSFPVTTLKGADVNDVTGAPR